MAKQYVRLSTKISDWKDLFNDLTNDVGDIALLTTSGEFVAGSDSDLVTAINELDYRLDSINFTQLNSPDMYIHDSARIGGQLHSGSLTVTGATALNGGLTMDTNKFTVADSTGNVSTAGTLTVTGATALNGGLTMDTNKFTVADGTGNTLIAGTLGVTGNVSVNTNKFTVAASTGNTSIAGTLNVDGVSTLDSATVDGTLSVTGKLNDFTLLSGTGDSASYIQFASRSRLIWGPSGIRIKGASAGVDAQLLDSNLDTVSKGTTSAINELKSTIDALNSTLTDSIDTLFTQIGDLTLLNTAAKSSLVVAINETHDRIPNIYDSAGTLLN